MDKAPDSVTRRQMAALLFVSMISPLFRQIPGSVLESAGHSAWLSALGAGVLFLPLGALAGRFLALRRPGEGVEDLFCRALGEVPGRAVLLLCALWLSFYAGFVLRAGADRFVAAVYPESPAALFFFATLFLSLPAGLGRVRTLGRFAEAVLPALAGVLLLVFALALPGMELQNFRPVLTDPAGLVRGVLPVLDTLGVSAWLLFLEKRAEPGAMFPAFRAPAAALGVLGVLLSLTTVGTFGAALAEKMNYPFFVMIRNLRLFHVLERIEAVVVAQWVVTDFVLLGVLWQSASAALHRAVGRKGAPRKPWTALVCATLGAVSGLLCIGTAFDLRSLTRTVMPVGNRVMLSVFPAVFLIGKLRRRL